MLEKSSLRHGLPVSCLAVLIVGLLVSFSSAGDEKADSPAPKLRYRTVGKTGMKVTAVAMDCMNTPLERQ